MIIVKKTIIVGKNKMAEDIEIVNPSARSMSPESFKEGKRRRMSSKVAPTKENYFDAVVKGKVRAVNSLLNSVDMSADIIDDEENRNALSYASGMIQQIYFSFD